jgi:hypothetical protein
LRSASATEVEESVGVRLELFVINVGTDKGDVSAGEQLLSILLNSSVSDTRSLAGIQRVAETVTESGTVSSLDSCNGGGVVGVSRLESGLLANINKFVVLELLVGDNISQNLSELRAVVKQRVSGNDVYRTIVGH